MLSARHIPFSFRSRRMLPQRCHPRPSSSSNCRRLRGPCHSSSASFRTPSSAGTPTPALLLQSLCVRGPRNRLVARGADLLLDGALVVFRDRADVLTTTLVVVLLLERWFGHRLGRGRGSNSTASMSPAGTVRGFPGTAFFFRVANAGIGTDATGAGLPPSASSSSSPPSPYSPPSLASLASTDLSVDGTGEGNPK